MKNQPQNKWVVQAPVRARMRPGKRIFLRLKGSLYIFRRAGSVRVKEKGVLYGVGYLAMEALGSFVGRIILVIALCQIAYYLLSH